MDPITATYYATICAILGLGSGWVPRAVIRIALGVIVGLAAAAALPSVRAALGV